MEKKHGQARPGGLDHHVALIRETPLITAAAIVRNMSLSREAKMLPRVLGMQANNTYQHVVPFGTRCYASILIERVGMRDRAYPIDWLSSSPAMILHCLRDDFATFLDRSHYHDWPNIRCIHHMFYRCNFDVDSVFAHVDPRSDRDYIYTRRAVARFRKACNADGRKLFFMVSQKGGADLFRDKPAGRKP
jgi:hypothetical protein